MDDYKSCATSFKSGVNLTKECSSSKVNATLYQQLVNNLIYITHSRPDISFFVHMVSWFMQNHRESYQKATKHISQYFKGTVDFGIKYCRNLYSLVSVSNSDWEGGNDDQILLLVMCLNSIFDLCFGFPRNRSCISIDYRSRVL